MSLPGLDPHPALTELLQACGRGDREAFARLYRLTSPKLFALLLRIFKNTAAAEECLQEAFINIWRKAATYDPALAAPMTWMVTITRNRALDLLRRLRPTVQLETVDEAELGSHPDPAEADGIDPALVRCLDELKTAHRECVELAYYEGLTHPELATRLNLPVGTVKTWIRRGLAQLRQCLET